MKWDDDYGFEFVKFKPTSMLDTPNPSPNLFVIYIKPIWDTLSEYVNQWGKTRRKLMVKTISRSVESPLDNDSVNDVDNLWLDMGARLYKALLPFAKKAEKYLKVLKSVNPLDKFDTWYTATSYSFVIQKALPVKKAKK